MSNPFQRTTRSLREDAGGSATIAIAIALVLLGAWVAWMVLARVPVRIESDQARIEVAPAVHSADARVPGTVSAVHVRLGQRVRQGEPLVELDRRAQRLQRAETAARRAAIEGQLPPLERAIELEAAAIEAEGEAIELQRREARSRHRAARSAASVARDDARRLSQLAGGGYVADAEIERARGMAEQLGAAARAELQAVDRQVAEGRLRDGDRRARWLDLLQRRAQLVGELAVLESTLATLDRQIADATVTAPIDGRIGDLAALSVGAVVEAGDRVASIVPEGALQVVATLPAKDVGRVRPGQIARFVSHAYPWPQFGAVRATVLEVASEAVDGRVRVRLGALEVDPRLPLEHGITGTVEIEIERISPWSLLLRAAGRRTDPHARTEEDG